MYVIAEKFPEIAALDDGDQLILAREIFDRVAGNFSSEDPNPEIEKLIESRMAHYIANPETAVKWEDLQGRRRAKG